MPHSTIPCHASLVAPVWPGFIRLVLDKHVYACMLLSMKSKKSEQCLAHAIRRADRVVSQLYNEYLAPLGIRVTQFSILRALDTLGTTTASQIQDVLVMDQTTVSTDLTPPFPSVVNPAIFNLT